MNELYFSRLLLRPTARDLYALHQLLWGAFGDEPAPREDERPFLFRADRVTRASSGIGWKVLVQSSRAPNWAALGESIVEVDTIGPRRVEVRPGERMRFFLRANATVSRKGSSQKVFADMAAAAFRAERGLRVAVRSDADAFAWLTRHAARAGFEIEAARVTGRRREVFHRGSKNGVLEGTDFEGHLVVRDVAVLGATLLGGIGRGRGLGFGLLSVAKVGADG